MALAIEMANDTATRAICCHLTACCTAGSSDAYNSEIMSYPAGLLLVPSPSRLLPLNTEEARLWTGHPNGGRARLKLLFFALEM